MVDTKLALWANAEPGKPILPSQVADQVENFSSSRATELNSRVGLMTTSFDRLVYLEAGRGKTQRLRFHENAHRVPWNQPVASGGFWAGHHVLDPADAWGVNVHAPRPHMDNVPDWHVFTSKMPSGLSNEAIQTAISIYQTAGQASGQPPVIYSPFVETVVIDKVSSTGIVSVKIDNTLVQLVHASKSRDIKIVLDMSAEAAEEARLRYSFELNLAFS